MIQDSNGCADDYDYFSRPEVLQQLRFNLAELINQDRCALQELHHAVEAQISLSASQEPASKGESCEYCPRWQQTAGSICLQLRDRSVNLCSVGHLAIKLIDFITEETARHAGEVQEYQRQADRLQNAIEEVTSRNTHIENDVMVFREQLEAAREELEEIAEEREEQAVGAIEDWQAVRDHKIQTLEKELEKMKSQLTNFHASALSKSSFTLQYGLPQKNTPQTSSLSILESSRKAWTGGKVLEQENSLYFSPQNKELQQQNQRLRVEIDALKKSTIRFTNNNEDTLGLSSLLHQSGLTSQPSRGLLRVRTSSNSIQMHPPSPSSPHSPFDFQNFLALFKSNRDERLIKLTQQSEKVIIDSQQGSKRIFMKDNSRAELMPQGRLQTLSSQWSKSSLAVQNFIPLQSQLVFLTHQSEEGPISDKEKQDFFLKRYENGIESKETEPSLKDSNSPNPTKISFGSSRSYSSIGINTLLHPIRERHHPTRSNLEGSELLGSRIMKKISQSTIVSNLTNFLVNNRVKRRSKGANSGTATILT